MRGTPVPAMKRHRASRSVPFSIIRTHSAEKPDYRIPPGTGKIQIRTAEKGRTTMKIVIIHGQSHEGSTCMAARALAAQVGGEVREFFLPRDFDKPCLGCYACFQMDLSRCPHFRELEPLAEAILAADLLILASPVYVYHATGQMMSFLDHFGTWWVVHRPRPEMSGKQAVAIATAAGGGMNTTVRDMADSLEMWGIRRVYRLGMGVQAARPDEIPGPILEKLRRKTDRLARRIRKNAGRRGYNRRAKMWFHLMRLAHRHFPPAGPDYGYWEERGWHGRKRPWDREEDPALSGAGKEKTT